MIPGSANPLLLASAAGAAPSYNIERSLRFNSADSASLTQASYSGSGTFSTWVKRCKLSAAQTIISGVSFNASDQLNNSTAVFRDPSAWMHVVVSSLGTYVNNTSVASGSAIAPGAIGSGCDLYLADIHFIEDQALTPSSFGYTDANGVWQPKAYTGTYGTNGFHLPFSDNSTAAALGTDTSGNGNTWTVNNLSVAAGAGNDSLVDTPTSFGVDAGNGGEVRGNYATLNPLAGTQTLANGNLDFSNNSADSHRPSTIAMTTGKWYCEFTVSSAYGVPGIIPAGFTSTYPGSTANSWGWYGAGGIYNNASNVFSATYTVGDVVQIAFDADSGKLWFGKNGTWLNSGNPAAGTGQIATAPAGTWHFAAGGSVIGAVTLNSNFGQRPFAYTAPSGYKALCTTNLPEPQTITTSGSYTGNGVADGPFVYLNGVPTAMTVNGTAVTFGTHADKLSNGFKLRTTSTTYNQNAATYNYSVTSTGPTFKTARAQAN